MSSRIELSHVGQTFRVRNDDDKQLREFVALEDYALEVHASALGTVGGPRTDARGRALDTDGRVIPGLYAAGNAGGAPTKGFYGGAGGTISLGLVFGYLAGLDVAEHSTHGAAESGVGSTGRRSVA